MHEKAAVLVHELRSPETRRQRRIEILFKAVRMERCPDPAAQRIDRKTSVLRYGIVPVPDEVELRSFELHELETPECFKDSFVSRDHGDQYGLRHLRLHAEHVTERAVQVIVQGAAHQVMREPYVLRCEIAGITKRLHCFRKKALGGRIRIDLKFTGDRSIH